METIIALDGVSHTFETIDGKTELKLLTESTPSEDKEPSQIRIPNAWLITRRNGFPLFAVRPRQGERQFRTITADKLYSEKIQWFEPLADNYRELIWQHPEDSTLGTEAHSAYKHFTWQQIIDFAIVDRWSINFYSGRSGDWKQSNEGGDGFLMVMVGSAPYWTDGIGQIPFAVDTFKMRCEELGSKEQAITSTIQTGMDWGDGTLLGEKDKSNSYDNFMVLRGALWGAENHQITKTTKVIHTRGGAINRTITTVQYAPTSTARLESPINSDSLDKYGVWKK
jgi:hypothetical protein